jgi:hypothetical protein
LYRTAPSKHSRAARRASSPGIDLDKSLKDVKPPTSNTLNHRPSVLGIHTNAGVHKKKKTGRKAVLSTKAKKRHEKAQDKAVDMMERLGQKVEKSKGRGKAIKERRKGWEEVNDKIDDKKMKAGWALEAQVPGDASERSGYDAEVEESDSSVLDWPPLPTNAMDNDMGDRPKTNLSVVVPVVIPPAMATVEDAEDDIL